ncbi:hypothetical protein ILUMI_25218 [Ignelater luminosus]|uniref:SHSP domain-containing protein n=1 Tax=Ignelater luminosus TaxID=2038154 RepID=A0A8K0C8Y1_IGNLU|nr:hypothetical protein ILUMI_25218 [Ignelater luminosus]
MSLLPFIFRDMVRPLRMLEHQTRMAEELFSMAFPTTYYRRKPFVEIPEDTVESVIQDKEKFQVKMDVQSFTPQEISVKTIDGNSIVVEGKHEEKQDDKGFISRQFVRRFVLPKGHEMKDIVSSLSSDGVLIITAPRKIDPALQERVIPITHTGPEKDGKKDESS